MMRLCACLLWLLLVQVMPAVALVNPGIADIEEQDWMANILIKGSGAKFFQLFCKGSLIHEYWVLSSPACFIDPFNIIRDSVGSDRAELAVALGNLGGLFTVEERITSPDGNFMLLRLNRPARNRPIKLLYLTPAELKGVQVRIFGSETSSAFADPFFNPNGELPVSCRVNGAQFFSNNRMCYVYSRPNYLLRPMMVTGQVIDPLVVDAPKSPLNAAVTPVTTGDRLYVNFIGGNSFPCHEDIGSPIIATFHGELVQVGVVVAVGMTTGVPMCNGSFVNNLSVLAKQEMFIATNLARGQFVQQCPARANLQYEKLSATRLRFYWDPVYQAGGYNVLYTPALGYEPIQSIDIGNITEAVVDLTLGETYALAIQAYNTDCTGSMSLPITVEIKD